MPIHISATELLLGAGDFLTIYLFGYMQRTFCEKRKWIKGRPLLVTVIYLLDWCMLFCANLQENPPLYLLTMISAYMIPLLIIYDVKSFRELANFWFYMVGTMVMEVVLGISGGYLNNEMGFHTQYELITPQTALLMNFIEMILVLFICRFASKEKEKKTDNMIFLLMAMPLVSVVLIVVDMFVLGMRKYQNFNSGQFLRTAILLIIVNIAIFVVLEKYTGLMRHDRRHFEALLYQLLEDGRTEEAKKYLAERLSMEPKGIQKYCENTTVNAAISHYISWAKVERNEKNENCNVKWTES